MLKICLCVLTGCKSKSLDTPTNFKIEGDVATWDAVEDATKYRLEFEKDGEKIKRLVNIPNNAFVQERHFRQAFNHVKKRN